VNVAIALAERGLVPDVVVRAGIRALLRRRLRDVSGADAASFLRAMADGPIAIGSAAANVQHYEVPAAFFAAILGPRLKYSACLWEDDAADLARAEEAMLDLTIARAGIAEGQAILELGCGWGSLTLRMAERFPNARVLAVSNSASQRRFVAERAAAAGIRNVEVRTADAATFEPGARFDRIVSVEMFEHLRNWPAMLRRVVTWLAPQGRVFLHVFCHKDRPYPYEIEGDTDWMARHFFTGGIMPSFDLLAKIDGPLEVERSWTVNGAHYARTLWAWLDRLDGSKERVSAIFAEVYGAAEAALWLRRWRLFLLACAELFAYRGGEEWFVGHYLLTRKET
jgi:cyclopropane-fatty-acyl-phospholipid synthase